MSPLDAPRVVAAEPWRVRPTHMSPHALPPAFRIRALQHPAAGPATAQDRFPPGIDPASHGHALFAHAALRRVAFADPAAALARLRTDPLPLIAAAWREARALDPRVAHANEFAPSRASVTATEVAGTRAAIVALPPLPCPLAVDFVAVLGTRRAAPAPTRHLYIVSERLLHPSGELTSRLGSWHSDGRFRDLGPGVPWAQLVFEGLLKEAIEPPG